MGKYDICVIGGAGHVGLPLAIAFANEGKNVVIQDINENSLKTIESGKMPFLEEGAEELLKKAIGKTLFVSSKKDVISESRYVIVVIGTPVDGHLNPTFSEMKRFFEDITAYLNGNQTIILRSTVFPGISDKINRMLNEAHPGISVAFCPERILEGKAVEELYNLPQIVSAFDPNVAEDVAALFKCLTKDVVMTTPIEAELAKLFTNSWRYIQFAAANQFYMIAEEYGVNFYNVFNAMKYNYPRTKDLPRPGLAAGPCLFKDTMQISAFTNNQFFLGHSAMLVNEGLPRFLVDQAKKRYNLRDMTAAVLGMAFKSESDDKRESLSYKLKKLLEVEAKDVVCSDPYVNADYFVDVNEAILRADIIFIAAPHKAYKDIDTKGKIVVDVWNHLSKK